MTGRRQVGAADEQFGLSCSAEIDVCWRLSSMGTSPRSRCLLLRETRMLGSFLVCCFLGTVLRYLGGNTTK